MASPNSIVPYARFSSAVHALPARQPFSHSVEGLLLHGGRKTSARGDTPRDDTGVQYECKYHEIRDGSQPSVAYMKQLGLRPAEKLPNRTNSVLLVQDRYPDKL